MAMAQNRSKKRVTDTLFYVLYVFVAILFLAPLLFLFISAMKEETQLISDMTTLKAFVPYGNMSFDNYVQVFEKIDQINDKLKNAPEGQEPISLSVGVAFSDRDNPRGDVFEDADTALRRMRQMRQTGCAVY